ncbi:sugar ABC transporter permease [Spirochaetia bacterium]|nr:sugar ABC transporter permease [Spirochaetia bacterium]
MRELYMRIKENRFTLILQPIIILVLIGGIFFVMTGGNFLNPRNINIIIQQAMIVATVSTGACFIFATGNVNIAMGSCTALIATLASMTYMATKSAPIMFIVAILLGVGIMFICVLLSTMLKVMVIHVTIVMMTLLTAIQSTILGGASINLPYSMTSVINKAFVPYIITAAFVIFSIVVFHLTPVGRHIKMIGSNEKAAELTGLTRAKALTIAFIIAGIGAGLAALLTIFRTGSITNTTGGSINTDVMIAIVLGGMPIFGGSKSRAYAPLIGAVTVTALNNGLLMIGVGASFVQGLRGLIFLLLLLLGNRRSQLLPAREG